MASNRGTWACLLLAGSLLACHGSSGKPRREGANRLWNPRVVVDGELAVPSGSAASREFSLVSAREVRVEVSNGKRNDHRFSVYVMRKSEWDAYRARRDFMHVDEFQGVSVAALNKKAALDSGVWLVVIEAPKSSEGALSVNVRVTADPTD